MYLFSILFFAIELARSLESSPFVWSVLGHHDCTHLQQLRLVHASSRVAHLHEAHPALQH